MTEEEFIKSLYQLAETCPQEDFPYQAFESLNKLVKFDAGGWGESAKTTDTLIILRAYMYKLPPQFYIDINEFQHINPVAKMALDNPSVTILGNSNDETLNLDKRLKAVIDRYDVPQILQTLAIAHDELFIYSTAINRNSKSELFTETERQIVERITPHLFESFRLCRRFSMQKRLINQWDKDRGFATCDSKGILHDADDMFINLLKADWPQWKSAQMPDELVRILENKLPYKSNNTFYRHTLLDDLNLLIGIPLNNLKQLSDREFQIAYNFSNGQTYKDIAQQLSIAPATVRNHLSSIYSKLDLNSKDQLARLFE